MFGFLDIRTLSLLVGLNSMAMAGIMVYISVTRRTYSGFHYWTLSFILGGLGMVLLSLRQIAPDWISVLVANTCVIAFPAFLSLGLTKFFNRPFRWWFYSTILAASIIVLASLTYYRPNITVRIVIVSASMGLLLAHSLFLLLKNSQAVLGFSNNLTTVAIAILSLWAAARALLTPLTAGQIENFLTAGTLQGISFIVYTLGCLSIMGGLITLNIQRMETELASADQTIQNISELIPICASCKKIRDDQGYWEAVESYIKKMTNKSLTHGICPECMKKLYPDFEP